MDEKAGASNILHVWVSPADTPIPLVNSPLRFAVGTPEGMSSNSWRVWIQGADVYVSCRDNFREFKVSLHSSGVWRVAFTEEAVKTHPWLKSQNGDRVLHRQKPDLSDNTKAKIGFQIAVLNKGLYLNPDQRKKWKQSVVFAEPPLDKGEMTVVSVVVAPTHNNLVIPEDTRGAVIGKLPLSNEHTVQLVVTHETSKIMEPLLSEAYKQSLELQPPGLPAEAVFLAHGNRPEGTPWISALRVIDAQSIQGKVVQHV